MCDGAGSFSANRLVGQMGDATNLVIVLAGEMLKMAEGLIRIGLHPSEIANGYEKACDFALKTLEGLLSILGVAHGWF